MMEDNIFEQRQAFNFYKSYYDTSLLLDGEDRAQFLESILHYQFTGELIEPTNKYALLAFRGQIHSLKKQVIGFERGKQTYPNGNPTKGSDKGSDKGKGKGSHKEVQVQEKGQVQEEEQEKKVNSILFVEIKNFNEFIYSYSGNKKYLLLAYSFWKLWYEDNPNNKTILSAKLDNWVNTVRLLVEVDKQSIEKLIGIYKFFDKCQKKDATFDSFWYNTISSIGGLRDTNKKGEYRLDKITAVLNDKCEKDKNFDKLVTDAINKFNKYAVN